MSASGSRSQSKNVELSIERLLAPKSKAVSLKPSEYIAESYSYQNPSIENALLAKHAKSQAKITKMRLKKQMQESESLQPAPTISKISKQIVEIREGKSDNTVNSYANQIISSTRSSAAIIMHPKHAFLSLAALNEDAPAEPKQIHRRCDSTSVLLNDSNYSLIRLKDSIVKRGEPKDSNREIEHASVQDLLNAVNQRKTPTESEKTNYHLLNMSVLQRNDFWLSEKNKKLEKEKLLKEMQETLGCTFSPRLTPQVPIKKDPRKNQTSGNSYVQMYSERKNTKKSGKPLQKSSSNFSKPTKPPLAYKPLSPHKVKINQVGSTLFENAVPMINYKT